MSLPTIIIASPHSRNDQLEGFVREQMTGFQVLRIKTSDELSLDKLQKYMPSFIFFPHWSWLIPEEIYSNFNCVVFHMTDLPYGRGGSPLQNLIVRGHQTTMLSALKCEAEMDAGPVYLKKELTLTGSAEEILKRASGIIEKMITNIIQNDPVPRIQYGDVIKFKRRKKEDGDLSKLGTLEEIYDYIRMLDADGYPRAFIENESLVFEFTDAIITQDSIAAQVNIRKKNNE